jgi:hypothetical protein
LVRRIREGKGLSYSLGKEVMTWAQNIHMVSPEKRISLTLALIRNPGEASPEVLEEIMAGQGLLGPTMVVDLEKTKKRIF